MSHSAVNLMSPAYLVMTAGPAGAIAIRSMREVRNVPLE